MTEEEQPSWLKRQAKIAWEGVVQNATWGVIGLIGLGAASFLDGTVPVAVLIVSLLLVLAIGGFFLAGANARTVRLQGERDEARRQARAVGEEKDEVIEEQHRALREAQLQLAQATEGQEAVSLRMQSVARQLRALSDSYDSSFYPSQQQVDLFLGLLGDVNRLTGGDPVIRDLANSWRDFPEDQELDQRSFSTALNVVEARVISIGTEEALGAASS